MQTISLSIDDDSFSALSDLVARLNLTNPSVPFTVESYVLSQLEHVFAAELAQFNQRQISDVIAALESMPADQRNAVRLAILGLITSAKQQVV